MDLEANRLGDGKRRTHRGEEAGVRHVEGDAERHVAAAAVRRGEGDAERHEEEVGERPEGVTAPLAFVALMGHRAVEASSSAAAAAAASKGSCCMSSHQGTAKEGRQAPP